MSAAPRVGGGALVARAFTALALAACERPPGGEQVPESGGRVLSSASAASLGHGSADEGDAGIHTAASAPADAGASGLGACPGEMAAIPGGTFSLGVSEPRGPKEERPRFSVEVSPFCLDRTEVTAKSYEACVAAGACSPPQRSGVLCNSGKPERGDHPMNCVTWEQADAFCAARGARLPSEVEWEYAASGGPEGRKYSWGNQHPDGRTCWKQPRSCAVGGFPPGAFGLFDMTGNVWEWTDDWFAPYPWPASNGFTKVYRGGSWSRRFEKWMRVGLRNRFGPTKSGSHLGFRCAVLQRSARCASGKPDIRGRCARRIVGVECKRGTQWNGARCASEGSPLCAEPTQHVPGHGCVAPERAKRARRAAGGAGSGSERVTRHRSPRFDADCQQHQPRRPRAYRFENGTHTQRNEVGRELGCKNRDVGVGWNSACCP